MHRDPRKYIVKMYGFSPLQCLYLRLDLEEKEWKLANVRSAPKVIGGASWIRDFQPVEEGFLWDQSYVPFRMQNWQGLIGFGRLSERDMDEFIGVLRHHYSDEDISELQSGEEIVDYLLIAPDSPPVVGFIFNFARDGGTYKHLSGLAEDPDFDFGQVLVPPYHLTFDVSESGDN
ncbi:MAG: hypothetical protein IT292_09275 [Deltaproteobacteria bacterium]|nr:hypothetical protein [Deltaproteobacteria bacterium]